MSKGVKNNICKIEMIVNICLEIKKQQKKMPITITISPETQDIINGPRNGIIWRFRPDETEQVLQTLIGNTINHLYIMPDIAGQPKPQLPSLEIFNTGHLRYLEINYMDIQQPPPLTRIQIPSSVNKLVLNGTTITDICELQINWSNITSLKLRDNEYLNDKPLIIPTNKIDHFEINFQRFSIIRLPNYTQCVMFTMVQYKQITGGLPEKTFIYMGNGMDEANSIYQFKSIHKQVSQNNIGYYGVGFLNLVHQATLKHIKDTNDNINHKLCNDFSNIPKRIKNAYENRENPIVAALHLSSNVPRRMAEFIMEFTKIN
jgi:hypothetical protein